MSSDNGKGADAKNAMQIPNAPEAERQLLGTLLSRPEKLDEVIASLHKEDFYIGDHRLLYQALNDCIKNNKPVDKVVLANELTRQGSFDEDKALSFINGLISAEGKVEVLNEHLAIVKEKAILRGMMRMSEKIKGSALKSQDAKALISESETFLAELANQMHGDDSTGKTIVDSLGDVFDKIAELNDNDSDITGVPTGFDEFDKLTSGLQPSDMVILAARPSMGKTAMAITMVVNAALHGVSSHVFSLEMPSDQITMRILACMASVHLQRIRTGKISELDFEKLENATNKLKKMHIFIDDKGGITPGYMRSTALKRHRQHPTGLIVIDYLQLMNVDTKTNNRTEVIGEISRSIKALAKEMNVPIIALSQLNRSLEQRPNKRPVNSDLRESGAIEQDADMIVFIYRDEVYNPDTPDKGKAEIIIGKQRNGPLGTVYAEFKGEYTRFDDISKSAFSA